MNTTVVLTAEELSLILRFLGKVQVAELDSATAQALSDLYWRLRRFLV